MFRLRDAKTWWLFTFLSGNNPLFSDQPHHVYLATKLQWSAAQGNKHRLQENISGSLIWSCPIKFQMFPATHWSDWPCSWAMEVLTIFRKGEGLNFFTLVFWMQSSWPCLPVLLKWNSTNLQDPTPSPHPGFLRQRKPQHPQTLTQLLIAIHMLMV